MRREGVLHHCELCGCDGLCDEIGVGFGAGDVEVDGDGEGAGKSGVDLSAGLSRDVKFICAAGNGTSAFGGEGVECGEGVEMCY